MAASTDTTSTSAEASRAGAHDGEVLGLTRPRLRQRSSALIGDVVVELGFAERHAVDAAIATAREQNKRTGEVLVQSGVLTTDQLSRVLAQRLGVDHVDLSVYPVDMAAVGLLDHALARRYQAVPIDFLDGRRVLLAMADPSNLLTLDDVTMITGQKVKPAVASAEDIRALLARLQRLDGSSDEVEEADEASFELTADDDTEAPAIRLVHSIIAQAVEQGASDIHCDPADNEMRVLFRVDGVIHPVVTIGKKMALRVISRIKVMASLNIAERRLPQDGRLAVHIDGRRVELRVVTLPLADGEGIVMRVLDTGLVVHELASIGMMPNELDKVKESLARRRGALLVTGPTGSGKSTTLYSALALLNTGDSSIITVEDPVETRVPGVKQMQVNAKVGMTFPAALRTMLRADPDIIMVGEIRDQDTAHMAVQAAITGHLVLSTLHTRDAPSALGRLMDMGIEPFMIASAVDCVVAQRLMRKLCDECKRPVELPESVLREMGIEGATPHEAVGCARCAHTGYRGRIGAFEVMMMSNEIRRLVMERRSAEEITAAAVGDGMRRLKDDALEKVKSGRTSMLELGRVASLV